MAIQLKRGKTNQIDPNFLLLDSQPGVEFRDNMSPLMKIGDGTTVWKDLPYIYPDPQIYQADNISFGNKSGLIWSNVRLNINGNLGIVYASPSHTFNDSQESSVVKIDSKGLYPHISVAGQKSCGTADSPWSAVYAQTGTIQTSDRKSKGNIVYLDEMAERQADLYHLTTNDVLEAIQDLKPATFCYKHSDGSCDDSEDCKVQLGLIADDLKLSKLYKYVGVDDVDEDGNHHLGLQVLPLAVAALTACKHLLDENTQLKADIAEIKSKM